MDKQKMQRLRQYMILAECDIKANRITFSQAVDKLLYIAGTYKLAIDRASVGIMLDDYIEQYQ